MGLRGVQYEPEPLDPDAPEMFSLPLEAPLQRLNQSIIKITTKTDENEQELHIVITAELIKPSGVVMSVYQAIPKAISTPSP